MPRIRCPNCGTSINLESRRELDYKMIVSIVQKGSKTFTELLKNTGLPRKTLSMRLAALCDSGVIVKDGGYRLNGSTHIGKWGSIMESTEMSLPKQSFFTRKNMLITLILLVIAVPVAASVYATLISSPPPSPQPSEPEYIGTFKMYLKVYEVTDLFAWQVVVNIDSTKLVVVNAEEGDFLKAGAKQGTTFVAEDDFPEVPNILLLGDTLMGMEVRGVDGSGTLAIVTFGYKTSEYTLPKIVFNNNVYETFLWDSNKEVIQGTLKLEI